MADNDQRDIINTLIAEALGEGQEGMRRVGETILNRSSIRGLTPGQVVRQPYQYTGYSSPGSAAVRAQNDPASRSAAEAAWALAQQPGDPTGGADHYFNPSVVRPSWAQNMTPAGTYGGHAFYLSDQAPRVATALATGAPTPATASPFLNAQRNAFGLPAYDSLAISPARGNPAEQLQYSPTPATQSLALASARAAQAANTSPGLRAALNNLVGGGSARAVVPAVPPISPRTQAATTPSNRQQQANEQQQMRGSTTQRLRAGLQDNTTPTPSQVNEMYAGGAVFPQPLDYVPPRVAPQPATMSGDMRLMRNSPLNNLNRAPVPATMSAQLRDARNQFGVGGPEFAMAPIPHVQSANMMLARDPRMTGLMPQNLIPAGNPVLQPMAIPVGTVLGLAANGGGVVQGRGGLLNSTTQSSDYWKQATGGGYGGKSGPESFSTGNDGGGSGMFARNR